MQRDKQVGSRGRCPDCGKINFLTRADAKKGARQAEGRGSRAARHRVYLCRSGFWHLASWQAAAKVSFYRDE